MPVYHREGDDPAKAWNELIRKINEAGEDCPDFEPLDEVEANHIIKKSDIEGAQEALTELCDENEFDAIPRLLKKATIDDLIAAIEEGACCCEDTEVENVDSAPIEGSAAWPTALVQHSVLDWAFAIDDYLITEDGAFKRWEVYTADMTLLGEGTVEQVETDPGDPEADPPVPPTFEYRCRFEEEPKKFPYHCDRTPIITPNGHQGDNVELKDVNGTQIVSTWHVSFEGPGGDVADEPPMAGKQGANDSGPWCILWGEGAGPPPDISLTLKLFCDE